MPFLYTDVLIFFFFFFTDRLSITQLCGKCGTQLPTIYGLNKRLRMLSVITRHPPSILVGLQFLLKRKEAPIFHIS